MYNIIQEENGRFSDEIDATRARNAQIVDDFCKKNARAESIVVYLRNFGTGEVVDIAEYRLNDWGTERANGVRSTVSTFRRFDIEASEEDWRKTGPDPIRIRLDFVEKP